MTEEVAETAKAVQEIAKTTGQVIRVVDKLGQFFATIMKEPIESTCGMLADTLKFKRWERQVSLVEKAEKIISEKHLSSHYRQVSPKLALPIFQNASIEDEESLHDLWAKLLVASLDPAMKTPRTAFIEIIKQLEPLDVRVLKELSILYQAEEEAAEQRQVKYHLSSNRPHEPTTFMLSSFKFRAHLETSAESYWAAVDNLRRLGLCSSYIEGGDIETTDSDGDTRYSEVVSSHGGYDYLSMTALGLDFVKICTYTDPADQSKGGGPDRG